MTSRKDEALRALYEEIAESIADASDEQIVEECEADGETVEQVANHMRDVLRGAWKDFQQRSLREAREEYRRATSALTKTVRLPASAAERRQLFDAVVSRRPEVGHAIHIQFRDFSELSDEDIGTCLVQFAQLGLMSEDDSDKQ